MGARDVPIMKTSGMYAKTIATRLSDRFVNADPLLISSGNIRNSIAEVSPDLEPSDNATENLEENIQGAWLQEKLKRFFQEALIPLRKASALCIVLALMFMVLATNLRPRYLADVHIAATGRTISKDSKATAIWLASPTIDEFKREGIQVRKSDGWEKHNEIFTSTRLQPAELELTGQFTRNESLHFFKTAYAGEVQIEVNGVNRAFDLFQSNPGREVVLMNEMLQGNDYSLLPVVFQALVVTARNLLLIFFLVTGLVAIQRIIPLPKANANKYLIGMSFAILTLFITAFYPGVMNLDSYYQYVEARAFAFTDWHPPVMALLWALTDKIIRGGGGMLILQISGAVFSLYLLSKLALQRGKKLFFLPLVLIFLPVVSCLLFLIVKDASLGISLLLAFSLWYYWRSVSKLNKPRIALILILVFYASAVRYGSLAAVAPLLFVFVADLASRKTALTVTVLLCLCFVLVNHWMVYSIFGAKEKFLSQIFMSHDILGVYAITGKNYLPEDYLTKPKLDELMKRFDHRSSDFTFYGGFPLHYDSHHVFLLRKYWLSAITQNPAAYLKHRWILFRNLLINDEGKEPPFWPVSDPVPKIYSGMPLPLQKEKVLGRLVTAPIRWTFRNYGFFFYAVTYLLVCSIMLVLSIRKRIRVAAALAISSMMYVFSFFPIAPGIQFRYVYWPVIATLLSIFVFWIESEAGMKITRAPEASSE